jgi:hypothetical protein
MTNREKAIVWAKEKISDPNFNQDPVQITAWERIDNPKLFLQTCISRLEHGSEREKRPVYNRVRNLKIALS